MNNNRDTNPELDYFELRRRHEEYKSRQRMTEASEEEPVEAAQPVADSNNARQAKNIPDDGASRHAEDLNIPDDEYTDEEYYGEDDDPAYDEPEEDVNPFRTLFNLAKGAKSKLSGKRSRSPEYEDGEYADDYDGDYTEGDYDDGEPVDEAEPAAKKRSFFARKKPEFDEGEYDDLPQDEGEIEDISDDASAYAANGEYAEGDYADDYEGDYEGDYDEEYADEPSKSSGFKRFLNMFVVRVDNSDGEEDDYYDDEYYEDEYEGEVYEDEPAEADDSVSIEPRPRPAGGRHAPIAIEGGQDMENTNKAASENAKPMAEALETSGMSRRERRELAMRKAAEEAAIQAQLAAKAAEAERIAAEKAAREAAEKVEPTVSVETAPAVYEAPVQAAPAAEKPLDMAAFSDATDDSIIVNAEDVPANSGNDSEDIVVEEPTREFKPVSMRSVQESVDEKVDLFSVDDEDEDEDEEEDERPAKRRGLFGRRKKVVEDDEDDYDDDEDEDDEDYDEDDDEEDERPAKRRGLFGRRKKVEDDDDADEDDDEDYDEEDYDDEEDEDEDDEYDDEDDSYDEYEDDEDEYDEDEDDYDDEDDFDDEDDKRSFGHHLIGVFKTILGIILTLLIVVIVLNVLYLTGNGGFVNKLHDRFGDSSAFNFLFFSYGMRTEESAELPAEASLVDAIDSLPTEAPVEAEPEVSIPDLNDNTVVNDFDFDTPDEDGDEAPEGASDAVPSVETAPGVEAADGNVG